MSNGRPARRAMQRANLRRTGATLAILPALQRAAERETWTRIASARVAATLAASGQHGLAASVERWEAERRDREWPNGLPPIPDVSQFVNPDESDERE